MLSFTEVLFTPTRIRIIQGFLFAGALDSDEGDDELIHDGVLTPRPLPSGPEVDCLVATCITGASVLLL